MNNLGCRLARCVAEHGVRVAPVTSVGPMRAAVPVSGEWLEEVLLRKDLCSGAYGEG